MNLDDYCRCEKSSGVHTEISDWCQYDVCNDCGKVLEDGFRSIDDNGDYL